jgi:uncharacterized protein DUF6529
VAAALYAAGRLIQPSYAFSMLGADPIGVKSLLATIALALAGVQVLLALWMYRRLPLAASPPRPVPVVHRVTGFVLFALTVPVAVHCLIAYGVQLAAMTTKTDERSAVPLPPQPVTPAINDLKEARPPGHDQFRLSGTGCRSAWSRRAAPTASSSKPTQSRADVG